MVHRSCCGSRSTPPWLSVATGQLAHTIESCPHVLFHAYYEPLFDGKCTKRARSDTAPPHTHLFSARCSYGCTWPKSDTWFPRSRSAWDTANQGGAIFSECRHWARTRQWSLDNSGKWGKINQEVMRWEGIN